MLKAGCLVLHAQEPGGDGAWAKNREDSTAQVLVFKKWLDEVITLSDCTRLL